MFLKYVWSSYNYMYIILKISLDRRKYLFNNMVYYLFICLSIFNVSKWFYCLIGLVILINKVYMMLLFLLEYIIKLSICLV